MTNRRQFLQQFAGVTTCVAASGFVMPGQVLRANDRIRIGLIGAGSRGKEIFKVALRCPDAEAVAVADVYDRHLDEVKAIVPSIKIYRDFRKLLETNRLMRC